MINLNCHIYRCGSNENCGLSDEDFRDTGKSTLQELVKDPARLKWHEACPCRILDADRSRRWLIATCRGT